MSTLPITHMTLYKHGVGFFERRSHLSGQEVELSFRVEEMNDILKSLTAIDWGGGQVLGIDYATPQSREERLSGCSIRLSDDASLQDLLIGLRGRNVRLNLNQGETLQGILLGSDTVAEKQPIATQLVSILRHDTAQVCVVTLGRIEAVEILDERGANDLRFFLQTALSQENYRQVTIRLTPGEHDLSVSYIAPAPTWRVSYRLVTDPKAEPGPRALLLGWGIFDNRLEEDLQEISLSLVAGMPISFIYDLYTPFTPERPVVEEENRTAAAPVEFGAAQSLSMERQGPGGGGMSLGAGVPMMRAMAMPAPAPAAAPFDMEAYADAAPVAVGGGSLGELFQYIINTPVTVGRGQSAMVPIVSTRLNYRKDLLYNGSKMPNHPVATLRLKNESGLTLERGPVTVLESGEYVGEALLPFTAADGEIVVPYAVELGVKIKEESGSEREIKRLYVRGIYLYFEEWDTRWRQYQLNNHTPQPVKVLIEHPRTTAYDLYQTVEPTERTDNEFRFEVEVPAGKETTLRIQERHLQSRYEELRRQSYSALQQYAKKGFLEAGLHERIVELLRYWEQIAEHERTLGELDKEREKIFKAQKQIQSNMGALSNTGKEGAMRTQYVDQLGATEERLRAIANEENNLKAEIEKIKKEIEARIKALD